MEILAYFATKTFFFGPHPEFVEILAYFAMKTCFAFGLHPRIWIFCDEELCFLVYSLKFEVKKFLRPPKNVYAPPQSCYSGARPVDGAQYIHNCIGGQVNAKR